MIDLDLQGRFRRFTARTRIYLLAILGVAIGGVYLSIAMFLELGQRFGNVPAACITGVVLMLLGGIPWIFMSFRRLPDPVPKPGDPKGPAQPPLLRAEQMGEQAGRQVGELFQRNAMAGVGIALALGAIAGYSPRTRRAVRAAIDIALREQDHRKNRR